MIPENYDKYEEFIEVLNLDMKCGFCSTLLREEDISMYDHEGGIAVKGHLEKQWVYVTCPNEICNYQWAWHKIVKRAKAMGKISI
ncbi:MAG TPA: hypothetical protein VJ369_12820 [Glutamicibacter sp.]|jgi:hypothetical protein|nr:hypothetical protein [Glutamicibacter sp.]